MDDYLGELTACFEKAKAKAIDFIEHYNQQLPLNECPACHLDGHVPGLACPQCYHIHPLPFALLNDGEFGYSAVSISDRKHIIAEFRIEE